MLDQIRWVPGALNPADAATRGLTVKQLRDQKVWLEGPEFLYKSQEMWPTQPEATNADVYSNLYPETFTGVGVDKKDAKITKEHMNTLALQPATDKFYELGVSAWQSIAGGEISQELLPCV
jgi:hypothetical protein